MLPLQVKKEQKFKLLMQNGNLYQPSEATQAGCAHAYMIDNNKMLKLRSGQGYKVKGQGQYAIV